MNCRRILTAGFPLLLLVASFAAIAVSAQPQQRPAQPKRSKDAIQDAQTPQPSKQQRVEQKQNEHDKSSVFEAAKAGPSSADLKNQPAEGKMPGFDFYRDPLGSMKPMESPAAVMQADIEAKPKVMAAQKKLLESRYNLQPKLDPKLTMTRGKPGESTEMSLRKRLRQVAGAMR